MMPGCAHVTWCLDPPPGRHALNMKDTQDLALRIAIRACMLTVAFDHRKVCASHSHNPLVRCVHMCGYVVISHPVKNRVTGMHGHISVHQPPTYGPLVVPDQVMQITKAASIV